MADYTGAVIDKLKQNGCIFVRHGRVTIIYGIVQQLIEILQLIQK